MNSLVIPVCSALLWAGSAASAGAAPHSVLNSPASSTVAHPPVNQPRFVPVALAPGATPSATPVDPGPRGGLAGAGGPLPGLDAGQLAAFEAGRAAFTKRFTIPEGLGPTFNMDYCAGCHGQPADGGSSRALNPQIALASKNGATNKIPPFIKQDGPALNARFLKKADGSFDGAARNLFTIAGRTDAPAGCVLAQPDFEKEFAAGNIVSRIGTPLFGEGLMEQIPNSELSAGLARDAAAKAALGIRGRTNGFGRLGWKAQQSAIYNFAFGASNGELGLSTDLAPLEAANSPVQCEATTTPNAVTDFSAGNAAGGLAVPPQIAAFIRFLAPPVPSADTPGGAASITRGSALFTRVGCALCHTPQLRTGNSAIAALRNQTVNLYSDLLIYDMGIGLADGIPQGAAGAQDWKATPLWGLGQRIFLLHDGRTTDLRQAILAHQSTGSEANAVIDQYIGLSDADEQDLLNFLRSL